MRGRIALQSTSCKSYATRPSSFRESSPQDESVRLADFRRRNAYPPVRTRPRVAFNSRSVESPQLLYGHARSGPSPMRTYLKSPKEMTKVMMDRVAKSLHPDSTIRRITGYN